MRQAAKARRTRLGNPDMARLRRLGAAAIFCRHCSPPEIGLDRVLPLVSNLARTVGRESGARR
jgi:hypothetical protein